MSKAPRRLMMTADAVGGVWTYALELATGLAAHEAEILLVVLGPAPSAPQLAEASAIPGLRIVVPGIELEWRDRLGLGTAESRLLRGLAREYRPDLVQINGFREATCGWGAPVVVAAHSCVRSWWHACGGREPPADQWSAYLNGVLRGLSEADAVVAPTAAFLGELTRLYGALNCPRAIHNGRSLSVPTVPRRPFILTAGRLWDAAKGLADLDAVAGQLSWPVMAVGDPGPLRPVDIAILGQKTPEHLLRHMAQAEIFVAPARYEPFGLTILEAATAGAALVLSDLASLRELWDGAARFVPPGDRQALGRALQEVIDDEPARRGLQSAAQARARTYSRSRMVDGYLGLYAELTGSSLQQGQAA